MIPPPLSQARPWAAAVVGLGLLASAAGCAVDDALATPRCASYDGVRAHASTDGLRVAPDEPRAGGTMTVGRTDDAPVHPGVVFLYGDVHAGCRVYALLPAGDEPAWTDITDEDDVALITTYTGPRRTAATYTLPESAEPGTYLLCGLGEKVGEDQRCRGLTLHPA